MIRLFALRKAVVISVTEFAMAPRAFCKARFCACKLSPQQQAELSVRRQLSTYHHCMVPQQTPCIDIFSKFCHYQLVLTLHMRCTMYKEYDNSLPRCYMVLGQLSKRMNVAHHVPMVTSFASRLYMLLNGPLILMRRYVRRFLVGYIVTNSVRLLHCTPGS